MKRITPSILILLMAVLAGCDSGGGGSGASGASSSLPSFMAARTAGVSYGSIWSGLGYDGTHLVVSTEQPGSGIWVAKYDADLVRVTDPVRVADSTDTAAGDSIADHKHLFQGGAHYIAFSTSGGGQGGYLYLLKLDVSLNRVGIVTVAAGDPPTNDMLLVGDGARVHVGKFLPGTGHRIYTYDSSLNLQSAVAIGGGENTHANGAGAVYANGMFYLVTPETLAPGQANTIFLQIYDGNWGLVQGKTPILSDPGMVSIVSAVSYEPQSNTFIVHYGRTSTDQGGPLHRLVYDGNWQLIANDVAVEGSWTRPHSAIVGNSLYVSYDGGSVNVARFDFTLP